jgi:hypothetical protein
MNYYVGQKTLLSELEKNAKTFIDESFSNYRQKRIDTMSVINSFQKYLQASKLLFMNDMNIAVADADLEYLLGGKI